MPQYKKKIEKQDKGKKYRIHFWHQLSKSRYMVRTLKQTRDLHMYITGVTSGPDAWVACCSPAARPVKLQVRFNCQVMGALSIIKDLKSNWYLVSYPGLISWPVTQSPSFKSIGWSCSASAINHELEHQDKLLIFVR